MKDKRMGKFIVRSYETWTDEEINQVIENIKSQIEGNRYGIVYHSHRVKNNDMKSLQVSLKMPHYVGRDSARGRLDMRSVSFIFWKEKGEIEVDWANKIYDPFDGVCYSGHILFDAEWCGYRKKTWGSYQKTGCFRYGDEISDLDYSDTFSQLYRDLENCNIV